MKTSSVAHMFLSKYIIMHYMHSFAVGSPHMNSTK